jgi:hypothetical protein
MLILVKDCRGIKTTLTKCKDQINSRKSCYNSANFKNETTCLCLQKQFQVIIYKKLCAYERVLSCVDLVGYYRLHMDLSLYEII